jgi:hypothetical protein
MRGDMRAGDGWRWECAARGTRSEDEAASIDEATPIDEWLGTKRCNLAVDGEKGMGCKAAARGAGARACAL